MFGARGTMRTLTVIALISAFAVPAVAGASSALVIEGDYQMGQFGWQMRLADAKHIYGKPTSQSQSLGICRIHWAHPGLVMFFGGCSDASRFLRFVGDSHAWQTHAGLRVGDPATRIRVLYPKATRSHERWTLIRRGSRSSLIAQTKRGHVVQIVVTRGVELSGTIG
jgi:hypothetical protein